MTPRIAIAACLFLLSACQQLTLPPTTLQGTANSCVVSCDKILSCIDSSIHLSPEDITSEFETLKTFETVTDENNFNRLICLALHHKASQKQLQGGEETLVRILQKDECNRQELQGLLHIIQGNINVHQKWLSRNRELQQEKKALCESEETLRQGLNQEITGCERRVQDLEQQVEKLKEIESMLDNTVRPEAPPPPLPPEQ